MLPFAPFFVHHCNHFYKINVDFHVAKVKRKYLQMKKRRSISKTINDEKINAPQGKKKDRRKQQKRRTR